MIKEIIILALTLLALSSAVPVEDTKPEVVPVAVPVETIDEPENDQESGDDLAPAASAWGGYGGWGRGYGWGGGWGRGYGGWGRGYGGWGRGYGGWGGYRGYGGWGRGYWG